MNKTQMTQPKKKALGIIVRSGANLFLPLACTFGGYVILRNFKTFRAEYCFDVVPTFGDYARSE